MLLKNKLALTIAFFGICMSMSAQLQKYQANYIFNFTRFIEWPTSVQSGDFVIGVLGKHAITAELKASAAQRTVGTQNVAIVEFASADEVKNCHILFVPDSKSASLKKLGQNFGSQPMMVITEEMDWSPSESTINFMVVDSKLGFKVNAQNLKDKQLKVSEKLLALSK